MAGPLWRKAQTFHQVGIVVPDLAKAMATMSHALGVQREDWVVFDHAHPFEHHEGDRVIEARTRYARAQSGATVYQLLEPVAGDTIWQRWLDRSTSIFALGYFIRDLPATERDLLDRGYERLAWGSVREGDAEFRYSFVRLPDSGLVLELMSQVVP